MRKNKQTKNSIITALTHLSCNTNTVKLTTITIHKLTRTDERRREEERDERQKERGEMCEWKELEGDVSETRTDKKNLEDEETEDWGWHKRKNEEQKRQKGHEQVPLGTFSRKHRVASKQNNHVCKNKTGHAA